MKEEDKRKIAMEFATELVKKFKGFVKTVVLVGSVAKELAKKTSDIDLVVIVDNVSTKVDKAFLTFYRMELAKMLAKHPHRDKLHITTLTLSSVWESLRDGEPAMINFLRAGIPLIDELNFFEPMQFLLRWGKIRPSEEAIQNAIARAPYHLKQAKFKLFSIVEDLYWAMVDSAHAILMHYKYTPPSPEDIPKYLRKLMNKNKRVVSEDDIKLYNRVRRLMKRISHIEVHDLDMAELGKLRKEVTKFVKKAEKIVRR